MRRDANRSWTAVVVCLWVIAVTACCLRAGLSDRSRSVFPIFTTAAQSWLDGQGLYDTGGEEYRYGPLVTVLFVPFALLPYSLGVVLWQLCNAALLLAALAYWCRVVLPPSLSGARLTTLFLLVLPLSVANVNNGQSNCLLLGLMLLAVAAVVAERWNVAALCLVSATLLKLYPLALLMLLVGLAPRRLGWRCGLFLALGLVLPFCFQRPGYVAEQYSSWIHHLRVEDRSGLPVAAMYRDVRLLCRNAGWPLSGSQYLLLQALSGACLFVLAVFARRRGCPRPQLFRWVFGMACCWMTVCGTATEACTYVLVAPSLAWALLEGWQRRGPWWALPLTGASAFLLTFALVVAWFPNGNNWHVWGLHPLGGLCLATVLLLGEWPRLLHGRRTVGVPAPTPAATASAA